jgi:iron complex transport system substrate-binding protein
VGLLLALGSVPAHAVVVTDHLGRRVEVPSRPARIVSLAPSLTETLFALGAGDRIAGVTDYCDYPPEARTKTKVGGMINPNIERLVALRPDLTLLTKEGNRRETLDALERLGIAVYVVETARLEAISRALRDLGRVAGEPAAGEALASDLERRIAATRAAVRGFAPRRALFLVWLQPVITVGQETFLDDLMESAGASSISRTQAQPWPKMSVEEILRQDPEYILVPRSSDFSPSREDLARVPGWRELSAVRHDRILHLHEAIQRPGPRIAEMLESLARSLHPEAFAEKTKTRGGQ